MADPSNPKTNETDGKRTGPQLTESILPRREPFVEPKSDPQFSGRLSSDPLDVQLAKKYDPDREFIEAGQPAESLLTRFINSLFKESTDGKRGALSESAGKVQSARIMAVDKYGGYRIVTLKSAAELAEAIKFSDAGEKRLNNLMESGIKLREAKKVTDNERSTIDKLRESFDDGDNSNVPVTGPFSKQGDFAEYLPMLGGPFSKQLYLFDYLDMHRKAFEAWNHNPLAHQIVKITTHFVLGRGVSWKACHPECQDAFTKWADDIDLNDRLEYWSDMLTRDGELMIRKFTNPLKKSLFVRWVDPSTIWEIITDLEDIERVFYYHQQYPTQYQVLYGTGSEKSAFKTNDFKSTEYVINQIPADEIWHYKINCSPNEKRGRSDLFPILGWLKRYKDLWTSVVLKAIAQSTFIWKNILKGSDADVQDYINKFGTQQPAFGSVWVENESSTLSPMMVDNQTSRGAVDDSGLVNMIAVGAGIPKEYIGFSDHSSRSTAVVGTEPGAKKFQARQQLLGRVLRDMSQEWGAMEIAANRLPANVPPDEPTPKKAEAGIVQRMKAAVGITDKPKLIPHEIKIEFSFPEIAIEDRTSKIKDVDSAYLGGYISKERAATMVAKELGVPDYDFEDEMAERDAEAKDEADKVYSNPGLPGMPGKPGSSGGAPFAPNPVTGDAPAAPKANSQGLASREKADIKAHDARPG